MADDKDKTKDKASGGAPEKSPARVEVLVDNLGPNLLKKGEITDDPQIVALLDKQGGDQLVRAIGDNC